MTPNRPYGLNGTGKRVSGYDFSTWLPEDEHGADNELVVEGLEFQQSLEEHFTALGWQGSVLYVHTSATTEAVPLMHSINHTRETSRSSHTVVAKFDTPGVGEQDWVCNVLFYVRCLSPLIVPGEDRSEDDKKLVRRYAICQSYKHPNINYSVAVKADMQQDRHLLANGVTTSGCVLSHADFGVCYIFDRVFTSAPTPIYVPVLDATKTYQDKVWVVPIECIVRMLVVSEAYPREGDTGESAMRIRCVGVPHDFRSG
jgi:hypothetical protein